MRIHRRCFEILLLVVCLSHGTFGAQVGDSQAALIEEKGPPVSTAVAGNRAMLTFSDRTRATLVDDRIVALSRMPDSVQSRRSGSALSLYNDQRKLMVAIAVGILTALLLFRVFFSDLSEFGECLRFYFQPDWISAFRGEWVEDKWSTMKLFVWLCLSGCAGIFFYGYSGGTVDYLSRWLSQ